MKNFTALSGALLLCLKLMSQSPSVNEIDNVQIPWEQQMATVYQNVDLSAVTTHVLLDRGIPMCKVDDFNSGTTDNVKACTFTLWQNLYGRCSPVRGSYT